MISVYILVPYEDLVEQHESVNYDKFSTVRVIRIVNLLCNTVL